MKKICTLFTGLFLLLLSFHAKAQSPQTNDYFVGKWNVDVKATPEGDKNLIVNLERKDGKLVGYYTSKARPDTVQFSKVEEKEKSVTVYFTYNGNDVYIRLDKKDDDHTAGSTLDTYDTIGERIKAADAKL
ncbi:hypothetical protein [Asinibacterium sp. OR53]|uniref:hypothetical protein n=1 Tax=Asinibacterium sp. OR53 TaxID=925409 RepID=UPI00047E539C|nr:hypothetical protein [Asinibacterium sp. OR53]